MQKDVCDCLGVEENISIQVKEKSPSCLCVRAPNLLVNTQAYSCSEQHLHFSQYFYIHLNLMQPLK